MLRTILRPSANVCLDNVTTIQERHLSIGLDPDLVACVLSEDWESGDVKTEFASLGELAWKILETNRAEK